MPLSHRQHSFLGARLGCDRWISSHGILRRTETFGVEQDERLLFATPTITPPSAAERGMVMMVLDGDLRATVSGRSRILERGSIVAVAQREQLITHGGYATTLELEWKLGPGALGEARIGERGIAALSGVANQLHVCERSSELVPHIGTFQRVLAEEGITMDRFDEATQLPDDPHEQHYLSALDHVLSDLAACATASSWESDAGMTRRTLTRQTHAFHRRYRLAGLAHRTDWRAIRDYHRTVIATIFLTHADATLERVARAIGYGAATALCHAFATIGLPAPGRIRALTRA